MLQTESLIAGALLVQLDSNPFLSVARCYCFFDMQNTDVIALGCNVEECRGGWDGEKETR